MWIGCEACCGLRANLTYAWVRCTLSAMRNVSPAPPRTTRLPLILAMGAFSLCQMACQPTWAAHSREVTATAYTLHVSEARPDGKHVIGAWGHKLRPGAKIIAVSRDLLDAGLTRGSKVWIDGLDGTYVVRDKMHHRWTNSIDIFMGEDIDAARQWGRRKVTIH